MATFSSGKARWGGQKENHETPMDKKRKLVGSATSGVKVRSHRSVLSVVNLRADGGGSAGKASEAGTPPNGAVIGDGSSTSAEAVEALLNLKMVGKTKFDFKVFATLLLWFLNLLSFSSHWSLP